MTGYDDNPLDGVAWIDGLQLLPQHFQVESARTEALVLAARRHLNPYHYGVRRVAINDELLKSGQVRIRKIDAVLPDGTSVNVSDESGENLAFDLSTRLKSLAENPATIHMCTYERLTGPAGKEGRIQTVDGPLVRDEVVGDASERVMRAKTRLWLADETTSTDASVVALPLFKVSAVDGNAVMTDYIPPTLAFSTSDRLGEIVSDILARVRTKAHRLADARPIPARPGGSPAAILQYRSLLTALLAPLFDAETLLATQQAHPFDAYCALARLYGSIAGIVGDEIPRPLAPYNHLNAGREFAFVAQEIDRYLDGIRLGYRRLEFRRQESEFRLRVDDALDEELRNAAPGRNLWIGLSIGAGVTAETANGWMNETIIAGEKKIDELSRERSLGAARRPVGADGANGIVPPEGTLLYAVSDWQTFLSPAEDLVLRPTGHAVELSGPTAVTLFILVDTERDR